LDANTIPESFNPNDTISGFAGIPRPMRTIAHYMKDANYTSHFVGKWDAGMATHDHTPQGRGYDSGLSYFHHSNDYYTEAGDGSMPVHKQSFKSVFACDR
jgi:arylsulfatase I/J